MFTVVPSLVRDIDDYRAYPCVSATLPPLAKFPASFLTGFRIVKNAATGRTCSVRDVFNFDTVVSEKGERLTSFELSRCEEMVTPVAFLSERCLTEIDVESLQIGCGRVNSSFRTSRASIGIEYSVPKALPR